MGWGEDAELLPPRPNTPHIEMRVMMDGSASSTRQNVWTRANEPAFAAVLHPALDQVLPFPAELLKERGASLRILFELATVLWTVDTVAGKSVEGRAGKGGWQLDDEDTRRREKGRAVWDRQGCATPFIKQPCWGNPTRLARSPVVSPCSCIEGAGTVWGERDG
jgi:hypothetical protein